MHPAQDAERNAGQRAHDQSGGDFQRGRRIDELVEIDHPGGQRAEYDRRDPHSRHADLLRAYETDRENRDDHRERQKLRPRWQRRIALRRYLISTLAPASSSFFLTCSASSRVTPSLTAFGALSTNALASVKPRLVSSRTALMTLIFSAPISERMTSNSVFSASGAAAAGAAAIIATGAAAETPYFSSSCLTRSASSRTVSLSICSMSSATAMILRYPCVQAYGLSVCGALFANAFEHANETALISGQDGNQPAQRIGQRTYEIGDELIFGRKLREPLDLGRAQNLTVDVGGLDGDAFDGVAERLERLGRRDGVGAREDDARRTDEKVFQLRGEIAGGDAKERVLDYRVSVSVLAKLAAKLGNLLDRQPGVVGEKQAFGSCEPVGELADGGFFTCGRHVVSSFQQCASKRKSASVEAPRSKPDIAAAMRQLVSCVLGVLSFEN